jgi:hypothetical protein
MIKISVIAVTYTMCFTLLLEEILKGLKLEGRLRLPALTVNLPLNKDRFICITSSYIKEKSIPT